MATMQSNQGLVDAYNALFSDSLYGALLRQRVRRGLQQRVSPGGQTPSKSNAAVPNTGTVTSDPFGVVGEGGARGGPEGPEGVPGGGVPGAGTPGGRGAGIAGSTPSTGPNFGPSGWEGNMSDFSFGFDRSSPAAGWGARGGGLLGGFATAGNPLGVGLGSVLGGGLGALWGGSRYRRGTPAPTSFSPSPRGGYFDPQNPFAHDPERLSPQGGFIGGDGYVGGDPAPGAEPGDPSMGYM